MKILVVVLFFCFMFSSRVLAYPEFQRYSKEKSGRFVNCGMCHMHSDGPEGVNRGQIGSLTPEELNALGAARQAQNPGNKAKSPILNKFGNSILNQLGRDKVIQFRQKPELLPPALIQDSDLDGDGIPDVRELNDGTDPLNAFDGHPWLLFVNNIQKNFFHILMIFLATGLGLYGIFNALLLLSSKLKNSK